MASSGNSRVSLRGFLYFGEARHVGAVLVTDRPKRFEIVGRSAESIGIDPNGTLGAIAVPIRVIVPANAGRAVSRDPPAIADQELATVPVFWVMAASDN